MNVRDCMNKRPAVARPTTRLREALDLMLAHGLRHVPVADVDGRFVGVVHAHDVRAAIVDGGDDALERGILDITELGTPTLYGDESIRNAWEVLSRAPGMNPLPVVRDGTLIGTISQHELMRTIAGLPPQAEPTTTDVGSLCDALAPRLSPLVPPMGPPGSIRPESAARPQAGGSES